MTANVLIWSAGALFGLLLVLVSARLVAVERVAASPDDQPWSRRARLLGDGATVVACALLVCLVLRVVTALR
ncbi:MAG: hypothetical protein WCA46_14910 [Actinocatenispora sp.]